MSNLAIGAAVIDRIEFGGFPRHYDPDVAKPSPFLLVDWRSKLVLSDGREYDLEAGWTSGLEAIAIGNTVSGQKITYTFTRKEQFLPLDNNHLVYIQKFPLGGKYYVELNYDGPLELTASIGETTATFSGNAIVVGYEWIYGPTPSDAAGAAPIGSLVPFEMHYELVDGATWNEALFDSQFEFRSGGWVDLTKSVPEPSIAVFSLLGLGAVLSRRQRKSRRATVSKRA